MRLKSLVKRYAVGLPGERPYRIRHGLLKGLIFNVDSSIMSQRILGLHEAEIAASVRRYAGQVHSAVDIGANDGFYSLYFASRPEIEHVVAADANGKMFERLHGNFALNDPSFLKKLKYYDMFVGAEGGNSCTTLDELVSDLPRPVLVKIDVDGGELDVLRGASRLIASGEANFVVETHSKDLEIACVRLLKEQGYVVTIVRNAWYRTFVPEQRPISHNRWFVAHHPNALS